MQNISTLIRKYDVAVPRYTSYPTVPCWEDNLREQSWKQSVKKSFEKSKKEGISLYIHLPFCESLCTYCGCNKRITKNHQVESPYIVTLLKEWQMYIDLFEEKPLIKEIHLGGGTPTFFSAQNLNYLIQQILQTAILSPEAELSVEVHPNYTKKEQLQTLFDLGFRRLSVGVQDFDEKVQFIINRPQSFEQTLTTFQQAREIGYTSINADIIYGLPFQTLASVRNTIELVKILKPERIAFYSYAHVPWKSPAQRRYTEKDLPKAEEKRELYELGRDLLKEAGYIDIGLDHFSLPEDSLYKASLTGTLHRNFMGYTTQDTSLLIGLGASSISDTGTAFMQNIREIEAYEADIHQGKFAIFKGHLLSEEDKIIRKHILDIMCRYESLLDLDIPANTFQELADDALVTYENKYLKVTDLGKMFLRNIAFQIDKRFQAQKNQEQHQMFSKSI
ncbi:MAG: oxygen-independent coproporphyrinogen III oxidase [Thermonemataceae bacterium]|nr:oxygen-independent coproporphyrinogen III oxidase [Thermonemataceae bacterium]